MNYWIFQSVVEGDDLRNTLKEGEKVDRRASRYRQQMSTDDLAFFWLGGPDNIRGIYGWGTLLSEPYASADGEQFRVNVRYDKRLTTPILVNKMKHVDELRNLLIFRAPQATNFILSREEALAIANLIHPDERPKV